MKRANSLYVHIPFCRGICAYCDFPKVIYKDEWASAYVGVLLSEVARRVTGKVKTIYVGGGTPTSLRPKDLSRLLSSLSDYLDEDYEFSVEANPETLDGEKAAILAENGVNRVSVGMQTSSTRLLKLLGRSHSYEDVRQAVTLLKEAGITNLNVDLMYGLPTQTEEEVKADLEAFLSLDVPHVSAYSLILEEGTAFHAKGIKPLDDDAQQAQFELVKAFLEEHGYHRYEISNFSRLGFECVHNKTYWKDEPYYGCGLGAAGYVGDTRYVNTKNLGKYLRGEYEGEEERLDDASMIEDFLLTNLRLVEGFDPHEFQRRFGVRFQDRFKEKIQGLEGRGLLVVTPDRVYASDRGLDLLDTVLVTLF